MRVLSTTLFALAATTATTQAKRTPSDAVLLSNIKTLTLHGGRQTTARRGPAVPQLDCVGGNAKGLHNVDVMRCTNAGSDYAPEDVQWTCQATLPSEFKLGSTEVVCEGYESSEDPYVLKGSCGVEYRLILTEAGERKYGERYDYGQKEYGTGQRKGGFGETLFTLIFWAIFLGEYPPRSDSLGEQADHFLSQVLSASSSAQYGQAAQVAITLAVDDLAAVAAGEEDTEAVATTATTTHLHHIPLHLLAPSQHRKTLLAHQPGVLASSLVRRLAQPLATRWATATTAVLRPVKQARRTGLEMEAARNLGLHGRLKEVEDPRVPHHLAGRGTNRLVSAAVVGGRQGKGC